MGLYNQMVKILSQLMAFTFITEILLSWKLWFPVDREFPMMSALSWFDFSVGIVGDGFLLFTLLIALIFIAIDKHRTFAISITLGCLVILVLEDITRFQPWVYTQGAILFLISFNNRKREKAILSGVMFIVASVYVWSGIQKFNLIFFRETFPWLLSAFGIDIRIDSKHAYDILNYLVAVIPLIEVSIGLFLLFTRTRKIGIITGLLMHSFIILSLGPSGHNWNIIIWSWNLCLMLFLVLYYSSRMNINITEGIKSFRINYIVLTLFGLMPTLNFIGYWDDYLSGVLYSGSNDRVVFYMDTIDEPELTKSRKTVTINNEGCSTYKINFIGWSIYDLRVPFYPANRYYNSFGRILCKKTKNQIQSGIEITTRSKFTGNKIITRCSCRELLEFENQ